MIRSLLVANRGEIAVRSVRAARERGRRSIALFSEPDRLAPHVLEADEADPIGPAAAAESYLRADKLIEVAKASGAEALHPGYGFLAEQASFAQAVEDAGLIFVGPTPETIAAMGDKTEARRRMAEAGVPVAACNDCDLLPVRHYAGEWVSLYLQVVHSRRYCRVLKSCQV